MEGTYTVKETTAPLGFALDISTHTVKIESEETTTFTSKEEPITDNVSLLLTKKPEGYPHDHGEGDATLQGAVYRLRYYDGQYDTAAKAENSGKAIRTWYFVTDANGKIDGQSPQKAFDYESDAFYKGADDKITYPIGTYVIEEMSPYTGSTVSRGIDYRPFIKDTTKTYAGTRDVPISRTLRPVLERALAEMKDNPEGLIFYDYSKSSVIETSQVNIFFRRLTEKAGIPITGQHSLHHTFATRCIEAGVHAIVLKK